MFILLKLSKFLLLTVIIFSSVSISAEEEEIYLKAISDQIQVITKDLKTLEKAVYQKSDAVSTKTTNSISSDGLNEDIMTKHLLKLNEIEDQFRKLTNKFEEVNFKLDKLSSRVTKIQSDTQLRFSDLENGTNKSTSTLTNQATLPGSAKKYYRKILFDHPSSLYVIDARKRFRKLSGKTNQNINKSS